VGKKDQEKFLGATIKYNMITKKIKNIVIMGIIGTISLFCITEKLENYSLHQQLANLQPRHDFYEQFFHEYLENRRNELEKMKYKLTDEERE
jgi:hypothetical protein